MRDRLEKRDLPKRGSFWALRSTPGLDLDALASICLCSSASSSSSLVSLDLGFGCVMVEAYRRERRVALRVAVEREAECRNDGRKDMAGGYRMYNTLRRRQPPKC